MFADRLPVVALCLAAQPGTPVRACWPLPPLPPLMPPFSSTLLQPRPSSRYYALLAERFCKLKREYSDCFSEAFVRQYQLIHRWVLDVWPRGWQCAQGAWPVLALCPLVSQWSRPAPQAHSSPGLSPPACVCFSRRFSECALPSSWRDRTCARAPCRQPPTSNAPPRPKKETKTLLNNPHPNPYPPTPQPAGWRQTSCATRPNCLRTCSPQTPSPGRCCRCGPAAAPQGGWRLAPAVHLHGRAGRCGGPRPPGTPPQGASLHGRTGTGRRAVSAPGDRGQ